MSDPDDNLGVTADPKKVKEQAKKANFYREREIQDMLSVLATRQGRRFVFTILTMTHWNEISFVDRNHDLTILKEGERNIGLRILALLREADPQAEVTMQRESKEDNA